MKNVLEYVQAIDDAIREQELAAARADAAQKQKADELAALSGGRGGWFRCGWWK